MSEHLLHRSVIAAPMQRCCRVAACALLLAGSAPAAQAEVYAFVDDSGVSHFSDSPDDARYALLPAPPGAAATLVSGARKDLAYEREIQLAARASQVEAALLRAVIAVESNFNPRAVSAKGALGLMQLMPATARANGVTDALDAQQNIRGGAQHLRMLLDRFSDNKVLALAAYNAGLGAVLAYGGQVPPFAETRNYVPAVLQRYRQNLAP